VADPRVLQRGGTDVLLAGAEFIAMLLVIVYVGAVAVLFLFVVMMLDIDFAELRAGLRANIFPLGALIGADPASAELVLGVGASSAPESGAWHAGGSAHAAPVGGRSSNIAGRSANVLYTQVSIFLFEAQAWSCWWR
jgi:NADH-quinone oxidoreductase subunit J